MNRRTIPVVALEPSRQRKRQAPKGRQVDPQALAQVSELLGGESRLRDLSIDHMHKIQDHFGQLPTAHFAMQTTAHRTAQSLCPSASTGRRRSTS